MTRAAASIEWVIAVARLAAARIRARVLVIRGAKIGRKVSLGPRSRVDRPWGLSLWDRAVVEEGVYFKLVSDEAVVTIAKNVFIGRNSQFDVHMKLTIGAHTLIAPGCFITDHSHAFDSDGLIDQQGIRSSPVAIGRDVWLGTCVVVLAGVTIGDGAVIAAHSVVNRDIPSMAVAAGIPAAVKRYRDSSDIRKLET